MTPYEERQNLLSQMRAYLDGKAEDPMLDEYDLVEVFDFAGDNNEPDLQERIMGYALKRYADFQPLLGRQALMLLDKGYRREAEEVYSKLEPSLTLGRLFRVLAMIDDGVPHVGIFAELDNILSKVSKFTDEEMIRFLEAAMDLKGGFDWLLSRLDTLKEHTDFQPTLLFEMSQYAKEEKRFDDAARLIEELTMIEPFEGEYWELLAETHLELSDVDKAEQDLEYALAINADSPRARVLKANIDIIRGQDPAEMLGGIDDLILSEDLDAAPLIFAVSTLIASGLTDKANEYVRRFIEKYPYNDRAIDLALKLLGDGEETARILEAFYEGSGHRDLEFWAAWLFRHYEGMNYEGAVAIGDAYLKHGVLADPLPYLVSLYYTNRSARVTEYILKNSILERDEPFAKQEYILLFVMSLIRTSNETAAEDLITLTLKSIKEFMRPGVLDVNIAAFGFGEILKRILKGMKKGTYPDEYDPLLMPQNIKK